MAERRSQRKVRCQNQYVYDRLASQKMAQAYHWLVPELDTRWTEPSAKLTLAENEKERRHLRPSLL